MAEDRKQLKILCLHGYRQNAKTFVQKTGAFRKIVRKYANKNDFIYIDAPHKVPLGNLGNAAPAVTPVAQNIENNSGEKGWWFSREDDYFISTDYSDLSKGFDASVELVIESLENQQFDGILGFSQGACLVSILCMMQQMENKNWFKFAILCSGFKSRSSNHDKYYGQKATIPSLHVYGENDEVVTPDRSEELMSYFDNPKSVKHPGGHLMPGSAAQKQMYLAFFEEMSQYCSNT